MLGCLFSKLLNSGKCFHISQQSATSITVHVVHGIKTHEVTKKTALERGFCTEIFLPSRNYCLVSASLIVMIRR